MSSVAWRPTSLRRAAVIGEAGGAGLLILAVLLPWVRYHQQGSPSVHSLHAGTFAPELVAVGVAVVVMAAIQVARPSLALSVAMAAAGLCGFALTVWAAADRMAYANSLTLPSGGYTTWSLGSVLALLSAALVTVAAVVGRTAE
jgi:hypothetical protein